MAELEKGKKYFVLWHFPEFLDNAFMQENTQELYFHGYDFNPISGEHVLSFIKDIERIKLSDILHIEEENAYNLIFKNDIDFFSYALEQYNLGELDIAKDLLEKIKKSQKENPEKWL